MIIVIEAILKKKTTTKKTGGVGTVVEGILLFGSFDGNTFYYLVQGIIFEKVYTFLIL